MLALALVVLVAAATVVTTAHSEANVISSEVDGDTDRCGLPPVLHGEVVPRKRSYHLGERVSVRCPQGFVPQWERSLYCGAGGVWTSAEGFTALTQCQDEALQCRAPEEVLHGAVSVLETPKQYLESGRVGAGVGEAWFPEGSVAKYTCEAGYRLHRAPPHPPHLTCHRGNWLGDVPQCVSQGCPGLEPVMNGYYLEVTGSWDSQYPVGAQVQFVCHTGYILRGPDRFLCKKGGVWLPRRLPHCEPSQQLIGAELCPVPPEIPHTLKKLVRGVVASKGVVEGTEVGYKCRPGYRNTLAPCVTHTLTCRRGQWVGTSPECEEFSSCMAPQNIPHGSSSDSASSFPLEAQVYYLCEAGYRLMGPSVLTCDAASGCWTPRLPPVCQRLHQYHEESLRSEESVLDIHTILVATTGSVIGILLIVLALILYQRAVSPKLVRLRNSGSGGDLPAPPHPRPPNGPPSLQDHDPDRVALIAHPDEFPLPQGVPPTYEEAVRHRPAIMFEPQGGGGRYTPHAHRSRAHRVGVPGVGVGVTVGVNGRRTRHRDNPDNISYQSIGSTRQSSSTSRSMSMRSWSACDSLGSTDTVAVSDSTNVTVETQSSGGASNSSGATSQAPSCRALAGSLASFDTSSLVNNEGAPLLEETEAEEVCAELPPMTLHHTEDQFSLSARDSDSLKDNPSHTRSLTVNLQE